MPKVVEPYVEGNVLILSRPDTVSSRETSTTPNLPLMSHFAAPPPPAADVTQPAPSVAGPLLPPNPRAMVLRTACAILDQVEYSPQTSKLLPSVAAVRARELWSSLCDTNPHALYPGEVFILYCMFP